MLTKNSGDIILAVSALRAIAQIGGPDAPAAILPVLAGATTDPNLRLEALTALGGLKSQEALPYAQDLLTADWPTMRAAATRAVAQIDPGNVLVVLSGLEPDPHWIVRAAQAEALGTLGGDAAIERLRGMLADQDKRVIPPVLESLTRLHAAGLDAVLLEQLGAQDMMIRAAAARAIGQLRLPQGAAALKTAYAVAAADPGSDAREAILTALSRYGAAESRDVVTSALADQDWAVRLRAVALLKTIDPAADASTRIRPAPEPPIAPYSSPELIAPTYSPHAFIETAKGTIEIELAVLDAPQTTQNFMALARKGYFNGLQVHRVVPDFVVQDGDPRGDGSGGPGYTIRDELNDRPFVRGTVGMALSGPDTGGSQFFIMHSPAPHLDAKYTVFGRVVNGMDVVDKIQQLDVIQRVRIWDGTSMQ
jgi:cyclophilin family peptidyl-prolyl cis-trans isomerase/HEAT repeat protein